MSRGTYNALRRTKNLPEIISFCNDMQLRYYWIAGNWHLRVDDRIDIYPTRRRYHYLPTGERGSFTDYEELGRIFTELIGVSE